MENRQSGAEHTRVFVTGGAGFIGSHVVPALLDFGEVGCDVLVYDNFNSGKKENLPEFLGKGALAWVEGDICNRHDLEAVIRDFQPQWTIHLAAQVSVPESIADPDFCYAVNLEGSKNVLELSKKYKVEKFGFSSSAAVYGAQKPPLGEAMAKTDDDAYIENLLSPYAKSKLLFERELLKGEIPALAFRFFNVYGPRQDLSGGYPAVIPIFIQRSAREGFVEIYGDGGQTRDFIYAGDIARGIVDAMGSQATGVFNLGSERVITINDLAALIQEVGGKEFIVKHLDERSGDIRHSYCEAKKAKKAFGFAPKMDLRDGISSIYQHYAALED